jgi:hypothetical protein
VLGALAGAARLHRLPLPVEREDPEIVAVRARGERVPAREERELLGAVALEDRDRRVGAGARLEVPEPLTVFAS